MKLYLITATVETSGIHSDQHAIWAGSQADAAKARKEMTERGAKRKDIQTQELDVPTKKEELLAFLNRLAELGNRQYQDDEGRS